MEVQTGKLLQIRSESSPFKKRTLGPKFDNFLSAFLKDLIAFQAKDASIGLTEVKTESLPVSPKVQSNLNALYPTEFCAQLALAYLFYFDCFPGGFELAAIKETFRQRLTCYCETNMQLFCLTLVSGEQVLSSLESPEFEAIYSEQVNSILINIENDHPEMVLEAFTNETSLTDFQIKTKVEEFTDSLRDKLTGTVTKVVCNLSLNSTNRNTRYNYFLSLDLTIKEAVVVRTFGARKVENEVMCHFERLAESKGLKLKVLEDLPRNNLATNSPEIFLAFLADKMVSEGLSFEDAFRLCFYNLVPFILNESDFEEALMDEQGLESPKGSERQEANSEFDRIEDELESHSLGKEREKEEKEKEKARPQAEAGDDDDDVNFDDDDFDDINDDF